MDTLVLRVAHRAMLPKGLDPIVIRVVARCFQADQGEEDSSKGGVPPRWQEWLDKAHQGGKERVPNPNTETRNRYKDVSFSTALKDKNVFRQAIKDYHEWAKKNPAPSVSKAPAKKEPSPKVEPKKSGPKSVSKRPDTSKMKLLGEGASRKVYDDGDTVVKVAKAAKNKKDNQTEVESSGKSDLLAPILEHAPDYSWVRQEKLSPVTNDKLAEHFGVSKADRNKKYSVTIKDPWGDPVKVHNKDWLFAATHSVISGEKLVKSASKYIDALKDLKKNLPGLELSDFAYANQWGVGKAGKPVIADYGFAESEMKR